MNNCTALFCFSFALTLGLSFRAFGQNDVPLHVVKSTIHAETENAEYCLEFNKPLVQVPLWRFTAALQLEINGKKISPPNIVAANSSLCVFPLERGIPYRLVLKGLRLDDGKKMDAPYTESFTISNRAPSLSFTDKNGSVDEFGTYDIPLTLRAVNIKHVNINVYRLKDPALMARAWQDRAFMALAPSESAYLVRNKGLRIWREEESFNILPNKTFDQKFSLREKMPDLAPGLYLIVADAGSAGKNEANSGFSPLAAMWFTKSDFSLRAIRDSDGIHVFASSLEKAKDKVQLMAFTKEGKIRAEAEGGANGVGLIPTLSKPSDASDIIGVIGIDKEGNVAFSVIENLPSFSEDFASGIIDTGALFIAPFDSVDVVLSLMNNNKNSFPKSPSLLRLLQDDIVYADFPVPALSDGSTKLSFPAPSLQGTWSLVWQKTDGTVLAKTPLRISTDPDAPQFVVVSENSFLTGDRKCSLTIKSLSIAKKPVPLTRGHVFVSWQKLDPEVFGWKNYSFGNPFQFSKTPQLVADFLTGPDGTTTLTFTLPQPPTERGLYEAALKIVGEPDSGVADASPLVLPLHPEEIVVGIKPLKEGTRFHQNSIARFALIGLSSDGKPRDVSSLSYRIYEEGRSFAWYQDEGRWKYKPEPQLRPIGSGALIIKSDASSILEWPVTAGNYRLEILNINGKVLAQTVFSAGWDSRGSETTSTLPLAVTLPKLMHVGREILVHVNLPEPSLLTAIIGDTRIRKFVHEFRPRGKNYIAFTPETDWSKTLSLTIQTVPQEKAKAGAPRHSAVLKISLLQNKLPVLKSSAAKTFLISAENPSAFILRKNKALSLTFGIENLESSDVVYKYSFSTSPGLKIENAREGSVKIGPKQSASLPLFISGTTTGAKELRLEVKGEKTPRLIRNWPVAVLPKTAYLKSTKTVSISSRQNLLYTQEKTQKDAIVFVSRRPMDGLAEVLTYVFNAHPFTTEELALSYDVLRLWCDTMNQAGIAPDFITSARKKEYLAQMLRHQNTDGGFASYRGSESALDTTAAALIALSAENSIQTIPPKKLAVAWIKQRLSNTWFNEKEWAPRAAAYASLATINNVDPSSLQYFSDTSAGNRLPAVAEAQIAAAFKHIGAPDAAAFWIKKLLDENGRQKTPLVLHALAATDALSSDDVLVALAEMGAAIRAGIAPEIKDAAALLHAVAANNVLAGKSIITNKKDSKTITGVVALHSNVAATYINDDAQPLYVTPVLGAAFSFAHLHKGASLTRRIFRLDGVELPAESQPARGEIHLVTISGELRSEAKNTPLLVQDGDNGLRPVGCPLSEKLDVQPVVPWLALREMTPYTFCEFSPFGINIVLPPVESDHIPYLAVFFARIDAPTIAAISPPIFRSLK